MIEIIKQLLTSWSSEKNQRVKMQRAYLFLIIILAVVSGLTTLVNIPTGRTLIMITGVIGVVYFVNAVAWMILDMIITKKIDQLIKPITKKR